MFSVYTYFCDGTGIWFTIFYSTSFCLSCLIFLAFCYAQVTTFWKLTGSHIKRKTIIIFIIVKRIFRRNRAILWTAPLKLQIQRKTERCNISESNKRNDKRFNNRGYSLFFLMGIFLKHLSLIPNILKWQDFKIFTKLVSLQTPSRSSHRKCLGLHLY